MICVDQNKVLCCIKANPDLHYFFRWYLNNCITLSNPYHNINHTLTMMYHIISIYEESINNDNYEFELEPQGLYILLLSALFHDYNHSAGLYDDTINVEHATSVVSKVIMDAFPNDIETASKLKDIVVNTIWATCYPYTIPDNELDLYQRIIRECDLLGYFSSDFFTQCVVGLKTEMHEHDWSLYLGKYAKFIIDALKNMKLSYTRNIIREHKDDLFTILNNLSDIIK